MFYIALEIFCVVISMDNIAIKVTGLSKIYHLYNNPKDRLWESLKLTKKKYYKEFAALNNINFNVKNGEVVGIIGTNGAGKSTLLKIITGVLTPSFGEVLVNGKVSALLELGAGFNQEYTGLENIYLNGRMMGYTRKEMEEKKDAIIEFADIGDFIYQPVKTYSSGMFARLAFAVAINVEPDILIVDEALSVGDIFFQNKCFKKFDELKQRGVTIIFVSHDVGSVRQMCNRVLWLEHGKQLAFGDANLICDMYMDEKRKSAQYVSGHIQDYKLGEIFISRIDEKREYPKISFVEDRFSNDQVQIRSVFFENINHEIVNTIYVDQNYTTHVIIECMEDITDLIIGFVLENNKGLPLYDINNFINQEETVSGKKGDVLDIAYSYKLPRIMNGMYLVGSAVAQGTQAKHEMLTWLHGIMCIEVINQGYNSSYIEIPSKISVTANNKENIVYI